MKFGLKKCAALGLTVSSVGVFQSPTAAQGPFEDVFVSSFQRTCDNIAASVNDDNDGVELQADCLNLAGVRVPASIGLRGVHKQSDGYVTVSPTSPSSNNLEGCAVTEIVPLENRVNIDLVCDDTGSTLRIYEITNNDGALTYESDKIYRIAAEAAASSISSKGQESTVTAETRVEILARVEGLLSNENPALGNLNQLTPQGSAHVLLDRDPEYDQAMVVSLTSTIDDDGNGGLVGSVELYDDPDAALGAYETLVAEAE